LTHPASHLQKTKVFRATGLCYIAAMNKRVITISEDLADLVSERQQKLGYATLDAAAAALISEGLVASAEREDHSAGRTDDELRRAIDDADTSGPAEAWDAAAVRAEVLRRYAARTAT
jgi:hypothetical protein